jgi:hypothetical protein
MQVLRSDPTVDSPSVQPDTGILDERVATENASDDEFPAGEIQSARATPLTPASATEQFVQHRSGSVRQAVLSTVAFSRGLAEFSKNRGELQQFLHGMVSSKALPKAEAAARLVGTKSSPTISKLNKIAEHQDMLSDPKIASLIPPGYTPMYECAQLLVVLKADDPATALNNLQQMILEYDGPITRDWFKKQRDKLRPPKSAKHAKTKPPPAKSLAEPSSEQEGGADERKKSEEGREEAIRSDAADQVDDASVDEADEEDTCSETIAGVVDGSNEDDGAILHIETTVPTNAGQPDVVVADAGEPITAALIVVREKDEQALAHAAQGYEWQRMADQMAEDSVVFVFAPLRLLLDNNQAIETFGCDRCASVYLLSEHHELELTKCKVLAIYERGEGVSFQTFPDWKADDSPFSIAEQMLQAVPGRRLQFFADAPVHGWEALTSDQD